MGTRNRRNATTVSSQRKRPSPPTPHWLKGKGGGRKDLFVCKGSNKVKEAKKALYPDKEGRMIRTRAKETHYEDTGLVLGSPEWKELERELEEQKKRRGRRRTEIFVHLLVTDFDADPHDVVRRLNLRSNVEPWRKGEPRVKYATITHAQNGFRLAPDKRCRTFESRVLSVLTKLDPARLRDVCGEHEVELSVGAYIAGDDRPPFHLPKAAVALMAGLGAEVDFDLYWFPEEDE